VVAQIRRTCAKSTAEPVCRNIGCKIGTGKNIQQCKNTQGHYNMEKMSRNA
jgi:hypothetical protein